MINKPLATLAIVALLSFTACKKTDSMATETPKADSTQVTRTVSGMYEGVLPCADCPGIETTLSFDNDSNVSKTVLYQDSKGAAETEKGKWKLNGPYVEVTFKDNQTEFYLIKTDSTIAILDQDKKEIQSELASHYILSKEKPIVPKSLNGSYILGEEGKGYYQTLTLTNTKDNEFDVAVTFKAATKKGCEFKGKGILVNNQIEVNLKDSNPDLKAVMTISVKNNMAVISTSKFNERYDLMYFCGGGGSLAGEYLKK